MWPAGRSVRQGREARPAASPMWGPLGAPRSSRSKLESSAGTSRPCPGWEAGQVEASRPFCLWCSPCVLRSALASVHVVVRDCSEEETRRRSARTRGSEDLGFVLYRGAITWTPAPGRLSGRLGQTRPEQAPDCTGLPHAPRWQTPLWLSGTDSAVVVVHAGTSRRHV